MSKRVQLRKVHINNRVWKYYVNDKTEFLIIFCPERKRFEISLVNYFKAISEEPRVFVTPGDVKRFIEEKLL